jgi:hypothetical protein
MDTSRHYRQFGYSRGAGFYMSRMPAILAPSFIENLTIYNTGNSTALTNWETPDKATWRYLRFSTIFLMSENSCHDML